MQPLVSLIILCHETLSASTIMPPRMPGPLPMPLVRYAGSSFTLLNSVTSSAVQPLAMCSTASTRWRSVVLPHLAAAATL